MSTRKSRRQLRRLLIAVPAVLVVAALAFLLLRPHHRTGTVVEAVDRTDSAAGAADWPAEVSATTHQLVVDAYRSGAGRFVLIGVGSNVADTAKALEVSLDLDCPNSRRCDEDLTAIASQVADLAARLAATPTDERGTDIVSAITTARDLCSGECQIAIVTDGQDSRLSVPGDPGELAAEAAAGMPSLADTPVTFVGVGADGAPTDAVQRAEQFLSALVTAAGGSTPRTLRSL